MYSFTFNAIGTRWQIDINNSLSGKKEITLKKSIEKRIEEYDKTYSRFRPDSFISKLSTTIGTIQLPDDAQPLFTLYSKLYKLTGGLFTPLIGQVLADAGYDDKYSLKPGNIRTPLTWDEAIHFNSSQITMKHPASLDFGAAGKGYIIDLVGEILQKNEIRSFCIDAGGDILYRSTEQKELRVGLENPDNFEQVIGIASLINKSICASAGSRRKWGKYHHIINPQTLNSPQDIKAVWVIADNTFIADAISTCLFFVPPERLLTKFDFEYTILYSDNSVKRSKKFTVELFLK